MRLIIDIITRDQGGVLAVACPEGALLSDAGVGGSDIERSAVQQAINAYYNNADARDRAAHPLSVPEHPAETWLKTESRHVTGKSVTANVAVDPAGIKDLLTHAAKQNLTVSITGEKVDGDLYLGRTLRPYPQDREGLVSGWDVEAGATRTFRIDGINRAEIIG